VSQQISVKKVTAVEIKNVTLTKTVSLLNGTC